MNAQDNKTEITARIGALIAGEQDPEFHAPPAASVRQIAENLSQLRSSARLPDMAAEIDRIREARA